MSLPHALDFLFNLSGLGPVFLRFFDQLSSSHYQGCIIENHGILIEQAHAEAELSQGLPFVNARDSRTDLENISDLYDGPIDFHLDLLLFLNHSLTIVFD